MTYHVLARKWRPQTFADLVGQSHVVKALTFALSQDQIHHAYLLTGTRGVGKTSIARIFAKSLNCENNGVSANPCGECESCREIKAGKFVDLIEVDAASRTGVDETRELIESVSYRPTKGRYKVYLIDEVHMFSKSSFNALLKTLEEPPAYVKFILATTDPEKLPITILSRCLQFNLKSLTQPQIRQHLVNICQAESIDYDTEALALLANAGDGSMRDTLSMTDQAIAYGQGNLSLSAVTEILGTIQPADIESILFAIATNNPTQLNEALHRLDNYEIDARAFLIEVMKRLQRMAWAKEGIVESLSPKLLSTVTDLPKPLIHLWYDIAEKALPNLALSGDPRKAVEMTLLRMIAFIPNDLVTRHRTAFDLPETIEIASADNKVLEPTPQKTATEEPTIQNKNIGSESSLNNESLAAKSNTIDNTTIPAANKQQRTPPWEEQRIDEQPNHEQTSVQHHDTATEFAAQVHSTPVAEQDSLEAAEDRFLGTSSPSKTTAELPTATEETDKNTADHNHTIEKIVPNTAKVEQQEPRQEPEQKQEQQKKQEQVNDSWHLGAEASEEAPPSMDDIKNLMQRGSDISAPTTKPQPESEPLSENTEQEHHTDKPDVTDTPKLAANIDDFDWFEAVNQLPLGEYTRHFVSLGMLRLVNDENRLQAILDLSPKHEVLSTDESLEEMQSALQKHFGTPINFSINLTDVYEQTPAEKKQQQQQQDRTSIVQKFTDDAITQRIVNELDGQIIDKTIRAKKDTL